MNLDAVLTHRGETLNRSSTDRDEMNKESTMSTSKTASPVVVATSRSLRDLINQTRSTAPVEIPLSDVCPNPDQPRKEFDKDDLELFALALKKDGQHTHAWVAPHPNPGQGTTQYVLIAGERRHRALGIAGISTIKAIVFPPMTWDEIFLVSCIENCNRVNISAPDKVNMIVNLHKKGMEPKDIAESCGYGLGYVSQMLKVASLPDNIKAMMSARRGEALAFPAAVTLAYQPPSTWQDLAKKLLGKNQTQARAVFSKHEHPGKKKKKPSKDWHSLTAATNKVADILEYFGDIKAGGIKILAGTRSPDERESMRAKLDGILVIVNMVRENMYKETDSYLNGKSAGSPSHEDSTQQETPTDTLKPEVPQQENPPAPESPPQPTPTTPVSVKVETEVVAKEEVPEEVGDEGEPPPPSPPIIHFSLPPEEKPRKKKNKLSAKEVRSRSRRGKFIPKNKPSSGFNPLIHDPSSHEIGMGNRFPTKDKP